MPVGVQSCRDFGGHLGQQCNMVSYDTSTQIVPKTGNSTVDITSIQTVVSNQMAEQPAVIGLSVSLGSVLFTVAFWIYKTRDITIPMIRMLFYAIPFPRRRRMQLTLVIEEVSTGIKELEAILVFGPAQTNEDVELGLRGRQTCQMPNYGLQDPMPNLASTNPFLVSVQPALRDNLSRDSHPLDEAYLSCTEE